MLNPKAQFVGERLQADGPWGGPGRGGGAQIQSVVIPLLLATIIVFAWAFPRIWYREPSERRVWFTGREALAGWTIRAAPVSGVAEAALAADVTLSAGFSRGNGAIVQAFLTKQFQDVGAGGNVFHHNPDVCWRLVGWEVQEAPPDYVLLELGGARVGFERRVFAQNGRSELVYFGALVGGEALPFRLNYFMADRFNRGRPQDGHVNYAGSPRLWSLLWNSFRTRRALRGANEFIRVSTPVDDGDVARGDALLQEFLSTWLVRVDYQQDLREWREQRHQ